MKEPDYSCPLIDSAIAEMEGARKIHNSLREWGHWWKDHCEEIERDYEKQVESLQDDVKNLELKNELLEEELAEMRRSHCQSSR